MVLNVFIMEISFLYVSHELGETDGNGEDIRQKTQRSKPEEIIEPDLWTGGDTFERRSPSGERPY